MDSRSEDCHWSLERTSLLLDTGDVVGLPKPDFNTSILSAAGSHLLLDDSYPCTQHDILSKMTHISQSKVYIASACWMRNAKCNVSLAKEAAIYHPLPFFALTRIGKAKPFHWFDTTRYKMVERKVGMSLVSQNQNTIVAGNFWAKISICGFQQSTVLSPCKKGAPPVSFLKGWACASKDYREMSFSMSRSLALVVSVEISPRGSCSVSEKCSFWGNRHNATCVCRSHARLSGSCTRRC